MIHHGDCLEVMRGMPADSVDAIVTDPPYGLGFMGKEWDALPPGKEWADECLRVLKPGGYLAAFGGSRTYHRLAVAVEDAGFEIRDQIMWLYGSGFPKSHDISKAIDKAAGAEREVLSTYTRKGRSGGIMGVETDIERDLTVPATTEAQKWQGYGTALKPAHEPIVLARKPLVGTVAQNVTEYGTGGLNIDGTRITANGLSPAPTSQDGFCSNGAGSSDGTCPSHEPSQSRRSLGTQLVAAADGLPDPRSRLLANAVGHALLDQPAPDYPGDCLPCLCCDDGLARLVQAVCQVPVPSPPDAPEPLDPLWIGRHIRESQCADHPSNWDDLGRQVEVVYASDTSYSAGRTGRWPANLILDEQSAAMLDEQSGESVSRSGGDSGTTFAAGVTGATRSDPRGGHNDTGGASRFFYSPKSSSAERHAGCGRNIHTTVKPIDLMRWLCRLVTPPGGTVLDPFTGSGTTGIAAALEGFDFIGIEREDEYRKIAEARIEWWGSHEGDTAAILERAGLAEKAEAQHRESGQISLLGE